jgi:hypothetical protein
MAFTTAGILTTSPFVRKTESGHAGLSWSSTWVRSACINAEHEKELPISAKMPENRVSCKQNRNIALERHSPPLILPAEK